MCQRITTTVYKYFTSLFLSCLFIIYFFYKHEYVCLLIRNTHIHILSGVKYLNSVFTRKVSSTIQSLTRKSCGKYLRAVMQVSRFKSVASELKKYNF